MFVKSFDLSLIKILFRLAVNLGTTLHPIFCRFFLVFAQMVAILDSILEDTFISFISDKDESKQLNFQTLLSPILCQHGFLWFNETLYYTKREKNNNMSYDSQKSRKNLRLVWSFFPNFSCSYRFFLCDPFGQVVVAYREDVSFQYFMEKWPRESSLMIFKFDKM